MLKDIILNKENNWKGHQYFKTKIRKLKNKIIK